MPELSEEIHSEIRRLSAMGDALAKQRKYLEAVSLYSAAWDLLPEPKFEWEAATWLLAAIGDANFLNCDYAVGRDNLSNAMHCPGAIGNPFLHLRLGQCQFEIGTLDRAADELMRAYMGAGAEIFKGQHPKYLRFLQSKAKDIKVPKKPWQFWK
jgi:tetratricopeptide (TPR) repeat protein